MRRYMMLEIVPFKILRRKILSFGLPVFFLLLHSCSTPEMPRVGQTAPDFSLRNLSDVKITLGDLTKKGPVLVNFWASWCGPCKEEVPMLNRIYREYGQRGLTVVGISVEDPNDAVKYFMKRHEVQYSILLDSKGQVARRYALIGFPTNLLLDRNGKILFQKPGIIDERTFAALKPMIEQSI